MVRTPLLRSSAMLGVALVALLAPGADATNTSDEVVLRVRCFDGAVHEGQADVGRKTLDVKTRRRVKLRYRDVASIEEPAPDIAAVRTEVATRSAAIPQDAVDPQPWIRLGRWAREQGLADEARAAFQKAVALAPDDRDARAGLLQVSRADAGADAPPGDEPWLDGPSLVLARQRKLKPDDLDGQVEVARWALRHGLDETAFGVVQQVLNRDTYHVAALELSRPFTARYRQRRALGLPVRGRWLASPDESRHHQRKAWAAYALDIMKVDAAGKFYRGNGRQLADHYAYDAPFYAMAAGRVVEVRDGFPDNPIGSVPAEVVEKHNGVSIDHGDGEVSWYVHAKAGSIVVKEGDQVQRGQLLGRVGNSGASSSPHLHVTLVAYRNLSVPWACEDYTLVAPDGTPIPITRACPREGWTFESREAE